MKLLFVVFVVSSLTLTPREAPIWNCHVTGEVEKVQTVRVKREDLVGKLSQDWKY